MTAASSDDRRCEVTAILMGSLLARLGNVDDAVEALRREMPELRSIRLRQLRARA